MQDDDNVAYLRGVRFDIEEDIIQIECIMNESRMLYIEISLGSKYNIIFTQPNQPMTDS